MKRFEHLGIIAARVGIVFIMIISLVILANSIQETKKLKGEGTHEKTTTAKTSLTTYSSAAMSTLVISTTTNMTLTTIHTYNTQNATTTTKVANIKKIIIKPKGNMYSVPKEASSFKTFMDWRCITSTGSPQYRLQKQACTDDDGIRMVGDYYCVALGSYYGSKIGTKYRIFLSTGKSFLAILADQKADCDTNYSHQYSLGNNDVIEFLVDQRHLANCIWSSGSVGSLSRFQGKITKIEKF